MRWHPDSRSVCRRAAQSAQGTPGAILATLAVLAALMAPSAAASAAPPLRALQADLALTTVSGLSSGAYMAGQFGVAYSRLVIGTALVAGGPYFCSAYRGSVRSYAYLGNALTICMNPSDSHVGPPNAHALFGAATALAAKGLIDDVAQLKRQQIYLFSGTLDRTVTRAVVDQTLRFYQLAGVPPAQIEYVNNIAAGHGLIVDDSRAQRCAATATPYINDCHLKQAHQLLRHVYARALPPLAPPSTVLTGAVAAFDQNEFSDYLSGLADTGYVYVPAACGTARCKVHVVFHGCEQGAAVIGAAFVDGAEYNDLADSNQLIVLYPQVAVSVLLPYNPRGCWDFWGYSSLNPFAPDFYSKAAPQMRAVRAMLARLAAPRR